MPKEKVGRSHNAKKRQKAQLSNKESCSKRAHSRLSENAPVAFSKIDTFLA